jgi:hypothetical protein
MVGINKNENIDVRISSLAALRDSIGFVREVIDNTQYRDYIVGILI